MKLVARMTVAFALVIGLAAMPGCGESEEVKAVQETWDKVGEACDRRDADYVLAHMANEDFEFYDRLLNIARKGKRAEIDRLAPNELGTVVSMRHRLSGEERKKMDARGWVRFNVAEGFWEDDPDDATMEIADIRVSTDGLWASAKLVFNGSKTHYTVSFTRSGDEWLLNTTGFEDMVDNYIRELAEENDINVQEFIVLIEEEITGREVRPDIYDRPT
ncbi:MAG: hypothetical protein H7Y88_04725 [Phycisphaerales bacterium]|nr:hypothetical protein [Phycisphaerales bacterium]